MGFKVVLVCAFLCMLQFHSGNAECVKLQIRVPSSSINGYLQNPQFNPSIPYPLSRNGNNICNSCRGSICNSNCRSNNPFKLKSPPNAFVLSVPSEKSPSGRVTITIDTTKPSSSDTPAPADNGEISQETVDVVVKLVPQDSSKDAPTISTSGKTSANSNKNSDVMMANTEGIVDIPGSNKALDISVFVNDNNYGEGPREATLDSEIFVDDGTGKVSETKTQAGIKKMPENNPIPVDKSEPGNQPEDPASDTPSPAPIPRNTPASSDANDSPVTGGATKPAPPDDTKPADTPTPGDSKTPEPPTPDDSKPAPDTPTPGDSKTPEPEEAQPGPPPREDNDPEASSGTETEAAAD